MPAVTRPLVALFMVSLAACTGDPDETPPGTVSATLTPGPSPAEGASATDEPTAEASPTPAPPEAWTRVATYPGDGDFMFPDEITYGAAGYLITAERYRPSEGGLRLVDKILWQSADGLSWEEAPLPEVLGEDDFIRQITVTPEGEYLMFVQRNDIEAETQQHIVLRSADAASWEEADLGLPQNMVVLGLVADVPGYLLHGGDANGGASLWLSQDALTWEQVYTMDPGPTGGVTAIDDIGAGDEGFVAFGQRVKSDDGSTFDRFSIASSDGRDWVETEEPIGDGSDDYRPPVAVEGYGTDWAAAVSTTDGGIRTFFSSDGITWEETGTTDDAGTNEQWDPTFVELGGGEILLSPGGGEVPGIPAPIFRSADGQSWERATDFGEPVNIGTIGVGPDAIVVAIQQFGEGGSSTAEIWVRGR